MTAELREQLVDELATALVDEPEYKVKQYNEAPPVRPHIMDDTKLRAAFNALYAMDGDDVRWAVWVEVFARRNAKAIMADERHWAEVRRYLKDSSELVTLIHDSTLPEWGLVPYHPHAGAAKWRSVEIMREAYENDDENLEMTEIDDAPADHTAYVQYIEDHGPSIETDKEEDTMKFETKHYVNGTDTSSMDLDDFLRTIHSAEKEIERLQEIKAESKAVKKRIDELEKFVKDVAKKMDEQFA